ncbi:MAG: YegS/Rv2252/BmrU family lipid kinase [Actinomycetota bacterium]|nr:YegS/Rv2252/BmrU family lipid kinase [Actinomycetota bacterium]
MCVTIAVVINPLAGRGRGITVADAVVPHLRRAGLRVMVLQGRDGEEAADLALAAVDDGVDGLVVVGGDGMVHVGAQAVADRGVPLGIIPAGTGNDTARSLGIDCRNPLDAADVVVAGGCRTVDLAEAGGHVFCTVLATGFDARVSERANTMRWPRGQLRYTVATLAELRVFEPIRYTLDLDGAHIELEAMLVAVGNGPSYGGGLRMCTGADLTDGLLDVVVIKPLGRAELVAVYPRLLRGTHVSHRSYEHHRVRTLRIDAARVVAYADGERIGALPMTVTARPGALRVFAPGGLAQDVR